MKVLLNSFSCYEQSDWPKNIFIVSIFVHDIRSLMCGVSFDLLRPCVTYQWSGACERSHFYQIVSRLKIFFLNTDEEMFTSWRFRYQSGRSLDPMTSDLLPIHFIITKDIYDTQVERLSMVLMVWVCSNKESYLVDLAVEYRVIFSV